MKNPRLKFHPIDKNTPSATDGIQEQKARNAQKISQAYADMKIHSDAWLAQELKSIAKIFGVRV
jgi:hypothetical protein